MPFRRPTAPVPPGSRQVKTGDGTITLAMRIREQPVAARSNSLPDLSEFRLHSVSFGRKTSRNRCQHIPLTRSRGPANWKVGSFEGNSDQPKETLADPNTP